MGSVSGQSSRYLPVLVLFFIGVALTVALYFFKARALSAKADLDVLSAQIEAEETSISVLKAELAFLESPARVSALAKDELGMSAIETDRVVRSENIDAVFPVRSASSRGANVDD